MVNLNKFQTTFTKIRLLKNTQMIVPILSTPGRANFTSSTHQNLCSSIPPSSSKQKEPENNVAIFWDLDNKPPKSYSPFDASIRLKQAAQRFGLVKYMIAYANRHAFRKALNGLETTGSVKSVEPYKCRVCGRRFYNHEKLISHFKQIHESEQIKRMNQIESAHGKRRVRMVAKYTMKMDKYKNAVRDILTPRVGYGLADELKRAGFWVRAISDEPQAAYVALRNHMVDFMDRRSVDCLVLVSDDSEFIGVLKEARMRCLKTVVVGDTNDGCLKRTSDCAFSWEEIMIGKAKKEAVSVVGKWKDRNVLEGLEWTYDPERDKKLYFDEIESEGSDVEGFGSDECGGDPLEEEDRGGGAWWELESRSDGVKRSPE